MSIQSYRFNVGKIEVIVFKDGGGPRDAFNLWPSIGREEISSVLSEHGIDPEALEFSLHPTCIKTPEHTILVDTGLGGDASNLVSALHEQGIEPSNIDLIIITHGHFDHIGGITKAGGEFVYPNARYAIWKGEWEEFTNADTLKASQNPRANETWETLIAHRDLITLIDHETEIVPGICAIPTPGHTVGHMGLLLESDGEALLHIADVAHHPVQVGQTHWSPAFDRLPDVAAATRKAVFERAARDKNHILAYHFTFPGVGQVVEKDGRLTWQARSQ